MNNCTKEFNSKIPVKKQYELKVCKESKLIQIRVKTDPEETTEYDIPFGVIAEVDMSTYGFLTEEEITRKTLAEYSASLQTKKVSTNSGSMLGRAIVGGLVAGPIGAIVGGVTASKKIEENNDSTQLDIPEHTGYLLSIRLNDIDLPYIKYDCGEDLDGANTIYSIMQILVRENLKNGFSDERHVELRKVQVPKPVVQQIEHVTERENKPISSVSMALYGIVQAIIAGLFLTVWNAGWWPTIIIFLLCVIQMFLICPLMDDDFKPNDFGRGIVATTLFFLAIEALFPYFATANLNIELYNLNTHLWINPYEGGIITFIICPLIASIFILMLGFQLKGIHPIDVSFLRKFSSSAIIASTINLITIGCASIVYNPDYIDGGVEVKIIGVIYAIILSIIIFLAIDEDSKNEKKQNTNYGKFTIGMAFQLCMFAIAIVLCAMCRVFSYHIIWGTLVK